MRTIKILIKIIFVVLMSGVFYRTAFCNESNLNNKNYLLVSDMLNYRNFKSNYGKIFFRKKNTDVIYFEHKNEEIIFKKKNNFYIFEYVKYTKKNIAHVFLKKNINSTKYKIGYYSIPLKRYFNLEKSAKINNYFCTENVANQISSILDKNIIAQIQSYSLNDFLDKESCGKLNQEIVLDFVETLQQEIYSNQDNILNCLNSSKVLNLTEQSYWLKYAASKSVFNIKNLFEAMSSRAEEGNSLSKKIKIFCDVDDSISNASSEIDSNGNFLFKINLKKINGKNNNSKKELIESARHEFLHYKSEQFSMKNNCLDEKYVSYITSTCFGDKIGSDNVSADSLFRECSENNNLLKGQTVATDTEDKGGDSGSVAELIRIQQQVDSGTSEALRSTLQYLPDIQIPSEQQLENLAKMPLTNHNGQTIAATGNSEKVILPESAANVLENMSSGFGQMADSLNKAYLAAITPKSANASVVAATSQSKVSSGGVQASGEAANSNTVAAAYTLPEILADSGLISNETAARLAKKSGDTASSKQVSAVAVNQQLDEKPTKSVVKTESTNQTSNGAVVKQVSSPGSVGTSSVVEQQASVAQADLIPNKRSIASVPTVQPTQNINVSDNKVLQTLSAYKRLSGNQYKDIQKMYTQQDFDRLLKSRGISILVKKGSNNQIVIGAQSKAILSFVDDGQSLTRNEKKGPNE